MSLKLTEKIERILFEDSWVKDGSAYMSHPYAQAPQTPETTIPDELPVVPSPMASMQLTDSAPPVDDDTYIPSNNKELAVAFAVLAQKVPDEQVENLYRQVRTAVLSVELYADSTPAVPEAEEAQEAETEVEREDDGVLEVRTRRLLKQILEAGMSDWSQIKFGRQYKLEDQPVAEPHEIPPDELKGKHIAQYWRDRPGKDPSKHKGSGESTVVTASGRLLQNIVRPLLQVPSEQLEDAVEYLRLQFAVLTEDEADLPQEADKAFSGMYIKKVVPKMSEADLNNFLTVVVSNFKGRSEKWLKNLAQKAIAETHSEKQAFANLAATVADEDPEQAEVLKDLFPDR